MVSWTLRTKSAVVGICLSFSLILVFDFGCCLLTDRVKWICQCLGDPEMAVGDGRLFIFPNQLAGSCDGAGQSVIGFRWSLARMYLHCHNPELSATQYRSRAPSKAILKCGKEREKSSVVNRIEGIGRAANCDD